MSLHLSSQFAVPARVSTVAERKAARVRRTEEACARIEARLAEHARANGGRYVLFGSWVDGAIRHDSDLDILVDFGDRDAEAWRHAEDVCVREGVRPDIHDARTSTRAFVDRVVSQGRILA